MLPPPRPAGAPGRRAGPSREGLAKGMGYWETLSELAARGKVFYLLRAKCQPVASSLGVALNGYVALLR